MDKKQLLEFLEPFNDDTVIITTNDKGEFGPFSYDLRFIASDEKTQIKSHIRIHRTCSVIA